MAMARAVGARVLLVGDIDRGGVFGSLVGTLETMAEWERELVHGLIINKFRGDAALLTDGLNYLVRRLGRPVLGVIPHLDHLDIPDEDSVAFKRSSPSSVRDRTVAGEGVTIAVIDTPRISNITDIDPLRREPDVTVRIVRTADDFGRPDAVILAGSKNVIADLAHLRANALAPLILAHAAQGGAVIGICGGLQMLGRAIADPLALEAPCGGGYGLSLLALDTSLQSEKILGRTRARYLRTTPPMSLAGYEIHHGVSTPFDASCRPIIVNERGEPIGYDEAASGAVWGTYLHGVFDDDLFRRHFIDGLRIAKGLAPQGRPLSVTSLDAPLDRLAAMVRAHLDMAAVYRILQRNFG